MANILSWSKSQTHKKKINTFINITQSCNHPMSRTSRIHSFFLFSILHGGTFQFFLLSTKHYVKFLNILPLLQNLFFSEASLLIASVLKKENDLTMRGLKNVCCNSFSATSGFQILNMLNVTNNALIDQSWVSESLCIEDMLVNHICVPFALKSVSRPKKAESNNCNNFVFFRNSGSVHRHLHLSCD